MHTEGRRVNSQAGTRNPSAGKKYWKNWWYYYKWYVVCGVIVAAVAVHLIGNAFGLWQRSPDFQVAYVGKTPLPDDTAEALKQAFAAVAGDFNGDGRVLVQVNQYVSGDSTGELALTEGVREELNTSAQIADVQLIGDIMDYGSYFFLTDDPAAFQKSYQVLANADGSSPVNIDFSVENKVFLWADCPRLAELDLGTYEFLSLGETVSGDNQELLSPLYLGRRCFYDDRRCDNAQACGELWNKLAKEAGLL